MEQRPATPPRPTTGPGALGSTPEGTRRMEESRVRSKALRDQREADRRASGAVVSPPKTASGLVATDDIQLAGPAGRKRPHDAVSRSGIGTGIAASASPTSNRDARAAAPDEGKLRPAPSFAKYVDYNFSAMTDTKGGFLSTEDDPWNKSMAAPAGSGQGQGQGDAAEAKPAHMTVAEWERLQLMRRLRQQKAGPFEPAISVLADDKTRKTCRECESWEIDWTWDEVFGCRVCARCKEKYPEKYSLLTKTECREDYLLTDPELRDEELLPHLSRPNPHKSHWHDMMLFLRYQVEDYAFSDQKWGSAAALDAEFERRESDKKRRKEAKFKEKLLDLKRKTRTESYRRNNLGKTGGTATGRAARFGDAIGGGGAKHVHEWGRTVENEEGATVKTCLSCGMEVEELEF